MNIKEYLENNGLKFSEFHQTVAYETGADAGVEFMENNTSVNEAIVTSNDQIYDALIKYKTIIDDLKYFDSYISDLERISEPILFID